MESCLWILLIGWQMDVTSAYLMESDLCVAYLTPFTAVCIIQGMRLFILKKKKMSCERDISVNFAQNDLNLFLSYSLKNRLVHHNKILLI